MSNANGPRTHRSSPPGRALGTVLTVLVVIATVLGASILTYLDHPSTPIGVAAHTPTGTSTSPPPSPVATAISTPTVTSLPPTSPSPTATLTPRPTATPTQPCIPPRNWQPYTVQEGDSLPGLALRYGISTELLVQANCLDSSTIWPGKVIWVPPPDVTPTHTSIPTRCGPPSGWVQYTVRSGDTLYSLARDCRTTVLSIKQANCLTSNLIYSGQKLWLPCRPVPPTPLPTATPTFTPTEVPTLTPTSVLTETPTPTPTSTSEVSPLPTPSGTPTATEALTPTPTETLTTTPTGSVETSTPTATETPTATPTESEGTPTSTPTETSTESVDTPTPTETSTTTPTLIPAETSTPTTTP